MYKVVVTKYNTDEGIEVTEFNYINEYALVAKYF